jgi:hypothetical protein
MKKDWQELTRLTGGEPLIIERLKVEGKGICIEGEFELPPMARFSMEDQIFIAAFVKSHGSIKQMEQVFGVSYPTIKNRLNKIAEKLDFVKVETIPAQDDTLDELSRGEISVEEAVERLRRTK